jgi:hypothetical protein
MLNGGHTDAAARRTTEAATAGSLQLTRSHKSVAGLVVMAVVVVAAAVVAVLLPLLSTRARRRQSTAIATPADTRAALATVKASSLVRSAAADAARFSFAANCAAPGTGDDGGGDDGGGGGDGSVNVVAVFVVVVVAAVDFGEAEEEGNEAAKAWQQAKSRSRQSSAVVA